MPYIEIEPIINPDAAHISAGISDMFADRLPAVHLRAEGPLYVVEGDSRAGKFDVQFPWLTALGDWEEFGTTEVAGTGIHDIKDVQAHKDFRPENVMNVHATDGGRARAGFAVLDDKYFDVDDVVGYPLSYFAGHDQNVYVADIKAGDVICFRGGVVAHR